MEFLALIVFVLVIGLCFLGFHKNPSVRVWGRMAIGLVFLILLGISCYLIYLGLWAPNRGNGIGPGIFLFIAVLPVVFTFIVGGILKASFQAEYNYWNKTPEERRKIDEENRAMAKEELQKMAKDHFKK